MTRSIEEILAHELLDLIFETFVDLPSGEDWGKPTLFACALACRSWRDLTFRHRFHSLTLYVPPEDMRDREPFSVQAFVALELGARAGKAARNLVLEYGTRAMSTDIAPDLSQFIHDFPLLQSLALSGTILTRFPIISARGLALASIKRLRISACSRGHSVPPMSNEPYALCDLLSQFGAIQELEFEGFMLGAETPPEPAVLQRMALPSIRALVHRAITFQGLAPLLRHMAKTHGIETLDMLGSLPGTGYDVAFATSLDAIPRNIYITVGDTWACAYLL
ncbi:hypothetical protein PsYK624_059890 [Phanerochaete sordida]|uniref:F-box domain-containing protein n=1 Tax=Phanerochaete sordida TaxID=48140 RepID=A0A9P3LDF5_9APHY|nr:hypothetical protein PsYK624_059890 [Phanerochaete sordida]